MASDGRTLDWAKVLDKLKSEARQDLHDAENAVRRARSRLTLLEALAHRHESGGSE